MTAFCSVVLCEGQAPFRAEADGARFGFARTDSRKVRALGFFGRKPANGNKGACAPSWSEGTDADDQPAHSQAAGCAAREEEGAGLAAESAKTRRLHPRLYDDAEEA